MAVIQLTKENFIDQVTRFGYFSEIIPECFCSDKLADQVADIISSVNADIKSKKKDNWITAPVSLSTYKSIINRRIISVPNPEAFLRLVKFMAENWDAIKIVSESENSLSPITCMQDYSITTNIEEINCPLIKEKRRRKSDFVKGIESCINISLGYQFKLKLDVANCYNSIYTHSVAWGICGKEKVKQYLQNKKTMPKPDNYDLGDGLDIFMRYLKNNETNGIITGPFTSRIFSEILFSAIDQKMKDGGFIFKRYVDDYKFYFRTREKAEESVPKIERILNDYNLNLNLSKIVIEQFPYDNYSDMGEIFNTAFSKKKVLGVLNEASNLYAKGEKGAYKYALKFLKNKKLETTKFDIIIPLLINIMLLDPRYGKYVISFMESNRKELNISKLEMVVNEELSKNLDQELQQEALLFLNMIKRVKLHISGANVIKILNTYEDFSTIIVLDIWKRDNKLVKRTRSEAIEINKEIKDLAKKLGSETYHGEHWLLLYEVNRHKLLSVKKYGYKEPQMNDFFKLLCQNDISFYSNE